MPACAASGASALPAADAEEVFGGGGVEAGVVEEATGDGIGVTATGTESVAGAIGGEGGFVSLSEGDGGESRKGEEKELTEHDCGGGEEEGPFPDEEVEKRNKTGPQAQQQKNHLGIKSQTTVLSKNVA